MEDTTSTITNGTIIRTKNGKLAIAGGAPFMAAEGYMRISYRILQDGKPKGPWRYTRAEHVTTV